MGGIQKGFFDQSAHHQTTDVTQYRASEKENVEDSSDLCIDMAEVERLQEIATHNQWYELYTHNTLNEVLAFEEAVLTNHFIPIISDQTLLQRLDIRNLRDSADRIITADEVYAFPAHSSFFFVKENAIFQINSSCTECEREFTAQHPSCKLVYCDNNFLVTSSHTSSKTDFNEKNSALNVSLLNAYFSSMLLEVFCIKTGLSVFRDAIWQQDIVISKNILCILGIRSPGIESSSISSVIVIDTQTGLELFHRDDCWKSASCKLYCKTLATGQFAIYFTNDKLQTVAIDANNRPLFSPVKGCLVHATDTHIVTLEHDCLYTYDASSGNCKKVLELIQKKPPPTSLLSFQYFFPTPNNQDWIIHKVHFSTHVLCIHLVSKNRQDTPNQLHVWNISTQQLIQTIICKTNDHELNTIEILGQILILCYRTDGNSFIITFHDTQTGVCTEIAHTMPIKKDSIPRGKPLSLCISHTSNHGLLISYNSCFFSLKSNELSSTITEELPKNRILRVAQLRKERIKMSEDLINSTASSFRVFDLE